MSTNPLERIPKRSPKTSVTDLNEFAKTAGSAAASAAYPIMLGLTGEDTGDEWYEDLAYGAVPGGALVQRAMTGTKPGLLDLLPGDVGAGARLAMLPIAKFGAEEIAKGAARMGKSARNMGKVTNPTVTRYHRTRVGNVDDIKREGLTPTNRNTGKNTRDAKKLPAMVWTSGRKDMIPVGRSTMDNEALFEITLPQSVYEQMTRFNFPNGRGGILNYGTDIVPVKGKDVSVSKEGQYVIDTFSDKIPPQYLKQIEIVPERDIPQGEMDKGKVLVFSTSLSDKDKANLPRRFRGLADQYIDESYDLPDWTGPWGMLDALPDSPKVDEFAEYIRNGGIGSETLNTMQRHMMEGLYYDNPADDLYERVIMNGGIVPYPGNGQKFAIVGPDFDAHKGSISMGKEFGRVFDGIGPGPAIQNIDEYRGGKKASEMTPEEKTSIMEQLRRNFEGVMDRDRKWD